MAVEYVSKRYKFTLLWKISNFAFSYHTNGKSIQSPDFSFKGEKWCLRIYPRGTCNKNAIACYLKRYWVTQSLPLICHFYVSIVNAKGFKLTSKKFENACFYSDKTVLNGFDEFISREDIIKNDKIYLSDDALCVQLQLIIKDGSIESNLTEIMHAETELKVTRLFFIWKINFNELKSHITINRSGIWITLEPVVEEKYCFLNISLSNRSSFLKAFTKYNIYICDTEDKEICLLSDEKSWHPSKCLKTELFMLPSERDVVAKCEFLFFEGEILHKTENYFCGTSSIPLMFPSNVFQANKQLGEVKSPNSIQKYFLDLYLNKEQCDFTLRVGQQTFYVHKHILASQSPVFAAMFASDMTEKNENCAEISDVDPETMDKLLRFIYTDVPETISSCSDIVKLYRAGVKYQINRLEIVSSAFLISAMNLDSVCDILELAELYDDSDLKSAVQDFMYINSDEVFASDAWKMLMRNNLQMAANMMQTILLMKSNSDVKTVSLSADSS